MTATSDLAYTGSVHMEVNAAGWLSTMTCAFVGGVRLDGLPYPHDCRAHDSGTLLVGVNATVACDNRLTDGNEVGFGGSGVFRCSASSP
jgi:hypothetical protein